MSLERLTSIERPVESRPIELQTAQKKDAIEQFPTVNIAEIFSNLPVREGVDLELFSSLVEGADAGNLRETVVNRYLDIMLLRKSQGLYGAPEVNTDMAIALLDSDTFAEVVQEVKSEGGLIRVATHEMGHATVASSLGWNVNSVTIVPGSSYLGLTVTSPRGEKSLSDWAIESAAISYGGALAAQMAGHEVRGHGSDFASARVKASIALRDPRCPYSSEEQILTYAQNLAHKALSGKESMIDRMAKGLVSRKTIV